VFFQFEAATAGQRVGMVERFLERMPDVPVAGLGADSNPDVVLAAMRAGARDFFVLLRDDANVAALLDKLLRRSAQTGPAGSRKQGKLFAVVSANPGEAIAFTAVHLALACNEKLPRPERVLLVDVATPAGAGAIFLNLNLAYSVLDAVGDVYRCDQTLVDTAFTKHVSGLYVLSLPEDQIGNAQINVEEFLKLLQTLRGLFGCVVVALDGHLPLSGMTGIIAQADRTLLLTDQSIIKSRHNKYLLRALRLEDCALDRAALVVDGYHRRLGLEPKNLAELLDLPLLAALGGDSTARVQAMNAGEPLFAVAPKDMYCADMRTLASTLLAGEGKAEAAPMGLLERWFS
ncbi:MAG: AAA family ATPase, partial [Stenotrophobium sp.]